MEEKNGGSACAARPPPEKFSCEADRAGWRAAQESSPDEKIIGFAGGARRLTLAAPSASRWLGDSPARWSIWRSCDEVRTPAIVDSTPRIPHRHSDPAP